MEHPGGTPDEHDAMLGPGTRLGKYEIVRLLGTGGMGAVYEAAHTEIGKRVAIKVLSLAVAAVPGARARFLREAQLTSRVRHPNIVDVTDMGSDAGQTYLVMEFLRGEDLAQRLTRTGPLGSQELADIMLPVCSAVVEAHKAGVTHRDLKPQNIFLALGPHTMQPKVLDFGISKGNDVVGAGALTGTGAMIGTPFYLAPEQIMDTRSAGPQSDQYALGVILYECLTGCRPFEAENLFVVFQAIVAGQPLPPRQRSPNVPPALEEIVLRAMSIDPKARFESTVALGRALLPFASARMRSIWEGAFAAAAGEDALPPSISEPQPRASAPMTPPVDATPSGRSRSAMGIQTPAVPSTRWDLSRADQAPANRFAGDPFDDQAALDFSAGRSRTWKRVAIVGVLIAGGAAAAMLALRPTTDPARIVPEAKTPAVVAPPSTPVVVPAVAAPAAVPIAPAAVTPAASSPSVASPPAGSKVNRPIRPPAKEPVTARPARRPRPPKSAAPHSLNPNGAPVID